MTQTGLSLGTPQYMSPEQAMGEKTIDARSDIYALGAVTYEMLTGDPPFTGSSVQAIVAKVLTEKPMAPRALRDTVPPHVEHAVLRCARQAPGRPVGDDGEVRRGIDAGRPARRRRRGTPPFGRPRSALRRRLAAAAMAGALVATAAAAWLLGRRSAAAEAPWSAFTQLTDASGVETSPSLSPDGESFAYSSNSRGSCGHLRAARRRAQHGARRRRLHEPTRCGPLTLRMASGSPTPERGGGIFVVGATGESARRLTSFGSNPAWSPDGKRIVFGSEEVVSPYGVSSAGGLWVVELSGGPPRRLDAPAFRESYQPSWSPSGARIAFWTSVDGQRDLETMPAAGGERVKVTNDAAVDWAPVWSPDGRFLFFASDRGGTMGIWRIALDERSGRVTGAPEPVASGVDVAMDLPHLSVDGTSLVFRSKIESVNPAAMTFDATAGHVSSVSLLQHRTGLLVPTDVSPDGRWLSLYNLFERQQDIFVMRADGSELTRLTDDVGRDWMPRFTPDAAAVTFYSNQGGKYEAWSIGRDGGGRTQLTDGGTASYTMFAPDGKRLMVSGGLFAPSVQIGTAPWPITAKTAPPISGLGIGKELLVPSYWSRDGRWLSGYVQDSAGGRRGHALFEVETRRIRRLNDDSDGSELAWLPGYRNVVYFGARGTLVMQNIESLERREITGTLPYPPDPFRGIVAAPDGRTLYYGAQQVEANIWLVKRQSSGTVHR